jgi:hypothetical protein
MAWNRYENALGAITGLARLGLPGYNIPGWPPGANLVEALAPSLTFMERFAVRREDFSNDATRRAFRKEYAAVLSFANNVAGWDRGGTLGVVFLRAVKCIPEVFLQVKPAPKRRKDPRDELEGLIERATATLQLDQATAEMALSPWRLRDQDKGRNENLVLAFEAALLGGEIYFAYGLFR